MTQLSQTAERTVRRVRHDTKLRLPEVKSVGRITPKMLRITVGGDELAGFVSAAHDDHVKLFFPQPGQAKPVLPTSSPNGPVYPADAPRPAARDYTPRRYDPAARTLAIDFVLHCDGPATSWAAQARPGDFLGAPIILCFPCLPVAGSEKISRCFGRALRPLGGCGVASSAWAAAE
jgi:NADPH-dependent ferric siderophore reductase